MSKSHSKVTEADTRANLIDPKLKADGWGVEEHSYIRREVICPGRIMVGGKRGERVASDYLLEYRGRKLAAVEAKKESLSYTEGVRQAKDYARRLQCRIAYATNGHDIYQIDMLTGEEKLVERYLSPQELWAFTFAEPEPDYAVAWRERFANIPFEKKGDWKPRYYQENAINNVMDAIARGEERILLTLATGTGKTAIAFQIAWKLFQCRWRLKTRQAPDGELRRPRILFLADRNILVNQAYNSFSAFADDALLRIAPDELRKLNKDSNEFKEMNIAAPKTVRASNMRSVPKNAAVFFTIFQTFMTGKDAEGNDKPYFGDYSEDFFDFIIIDECHRGGAKDQSSWREILEYFSPAVQLGLTATPKRKDNVDTYAYFGEPVYSYTLKEGVNDGFLTPFKVFQIVGTMDEYVHTPGDGMIIQGDPEPGRVYREGDFNRVITIPEREQKRVHYWMDRFNPKEKTIVFCATQEHAGLVRDYINQYAVQKGFSNNTHYCVRVTANDGARGESDLGTFQDNEKTIPTILTTSRKLSTGVDARNVRNIVLMRLCNNMIEFKQIIGRGTRMYDGKDFFTIYDFVRAHQNFADPEWDGEPILAEENPPRATPEMREDRADFHVDTLDEGDDTAEQRPEKIRIKLSDGKVRQIKHVSSVMYWSPEGKPITPNEFVQRLYDDVPQFFENEDRLREIWSDPSTREKLLQQLAEAGYDAEKLDSMKDLIDANDSDVYDVLAYVAYAIETRTRLERVAHANPTIHSAFADKRQQAFIDFILSKYVEDGVEELAENKMRSLVELKYRTLSDAAREFGSVKAIRDTFIGFQKYLYSD